MNYIGTMRFTCIMYSKFTIYNTNYVLQIYKLQIYKK